MFDRSSTEDVATPFRWINGRDEYECVCEWLYGLSARNGSNGNDASWKRYRQFSIFGRQLQLGNTNACDSADLCVDRFGTRKDV